ncbi:hypothetical protein GCM10025864_26330 [Luteimicrobium album]|uniref:Glycosyltransferase 2-like domain-containing protein n=1 Tax=Luteimicrobium album TaxID=1054550 RepID=A0ABQ6I4X5_9MICO|nr:glycosyltransferase [Luteimicrobium album]GMA24874.1 hypothetical protein GCM10025864_26330 [Luteimicrobium album]
MSGPLVSVVVCTNRGGPYLDEALRSVGAQTYDAVECVLVDDGVPDPAALAGLLAPFPDVRVVRTETSGISAARNRGLAEARGELVAFLDDDDRWDPRRLELQVPALAADPALVAGYCGLRTIDADGIVLVEADQVPVASRVDVARGRGGMLLPNLLLRRSAVESVGSFSTRFRTAEDLDLVLRLSALGGFGFVPDALVDYRHHGQNTTARYRQLAASIRAVVRDQERAALQAGDEPLVAALRERDAANDRFAAWSAARSVRAALRARDVGRALGDIGWAARFAPRAPLLWLRQRVRRRP